MSTFVPFGKIAKELSMLKILGDCGFELHPKKNSPNSKAKIFQRNSRTLLYYNNPSGEYFVDGDNNNTKGDAINLLYELGVINSTEELLEYYNANSDIKHQLTQKVFEEKKVPTFEELLERFSPVAFKQLGAFNYLNSRNIHQDLLDKYPKDIVAQSPKKFKGTHNVIFNLYHFDKNNNRHILASQMIKNNGFSGGVEDGIKSQSLWLSSFNKSFTKVYIFEDPIDALSYEQMHLKGKADSDYLLVATCGRAAKGQYLELIKHISAVPLQNIDIHYCNDNDFHGRKANVELFNALNNYYHNTDIRSTFDNNKKEVTLTVVTATLSEKQLEGLSKIVDTVKQQEKGVSQYTFELSELNCKAYFDTFSDMNIRLNNNLQVPKFDDWNYMLGQQNQQQQMEL